MLLKGRAVPAYGPIPPDIAGFDPELKTNAQLFDPAAPRALLDRFGYKDRDGDGFRETPEGKPLVIERWSTPNSITRQGDELWKKNMDAIGIRIVFKKDRPPELRKMARLGKIPMRSRRLERRLSRRREFYAAPVRPERGPGEQREFRAASIRQALREAPRASRFAGAHEALQQDDRALLAYAPWRMSYHLIEDQLLQPWIRGYKPHPIESQTWPYVDLDASTKP